MVVQVLDSMPDLDARPCARPKIYEILKFDELQVFSVFNDMNDVSIEFNWFSGKNGKFDDFNTICEMSGL